MGVGVGVGVDVGECIDIIYTPAVEYSLIQHLPTKMIQEDGGEMEDGNGNGNREIEVITREDGNGDGEDEEEAYGY